MTKIRPQMRTTTDFEKKMAAVIVYANVLEIADAT